MKPIGVTKPITGGKKTSADRVWESVPHMSVSVGGYDFNAPVAVRYTRGRQEIESDVYGYIYALPCGGRVNSIGNVLQWSKN